MYTSLPGSRNSETHLPSNISAPEECTSQYGRTSSPERSLIENEESTSTLSPSPGVSSPDSQSIDLEKSDMQTEPESKKRGWRFYGSFACLAILNLVCAIDATILSVALPPTWAAFSHIIGRKSVLLTALFLFSVGTILCSVAKNIELLLVGRCIQGIGGGGLVSLTYVLLADMVTLRERGKWMSIISLQWAIGSVIAPVIGGAFAEKVTWRWIFWLNIPFCVVSAIGIPICLKLNIKQGSMWTKLKAFDWFGSFLFVASVTSFLIPLTWGGVMYAWSSVRTLVPLLVGVGLIIAKTGRYRPSIWVGWAISTLGLGLLILLKESTSTVSWIFFNLVPGIGLGTLFSAQGFAAQASVTNADLPFAGAMYSFFRAFGQTIGVAISGVIFQNTFQNKILKTSYAVYANDWSKDASAFVQIVKVWSNTGAEGEMKQVVIGAYVESLKMVWIVMCALAGLAFVTSLVFTKEIAMSKELETDQGFDYGYGDRKGRGSSRTIVPITPQHNGDMAV
ncbi:hypothetical protein BCON_0231g00220 [Botryotinia convoluta]|uniref:Major facilitator superfamily (MFS) profile domain-containing protein n=1 Tax=Botryotinia convoluta TaxID=54673 RepID=A0A4Z1HI68_9HELO|nr:hypothetical protein BCON_0231g00220 [Botryotinia convoluta]